MFEILYIVITSIIIYLFNNDFALVSAAIYLVYTIQQQNLDQNINQNLENHLLLTHGM